MYMVKARGTATKKNLNSSNAIDLNLLMVDLIVTQLILKLN
jgi:hypothetical protein